MNTTNTQTELDALPADGLLRIREVLRFIRVGESTLWAGVKTGRFPKPIKLGPRTTRWIASDIRQYIDTFKAQ